MFMFKLDKPLAWMSCRLLHANGSILFFEAFTISGVSVVKVSPHDVVSVFRNSRAERDARNGIIAY